MSGELGLAISWFLFAVIMSAVYFVGWNIEMETVNGTRRTKRVDGKICFKKFADNKTVILWGIVNVGYCLLISIYGIIAHFYPPIALKNIQAYVIIPLLFLSLFPIISMAGYVYRKNKGIVYKKNSDGEVQYDDKENNEQQN